MRSLFRSTIARRLMGFSGLSLLSAIGPLALLPVVARMSGQAEWAALGIGQSVGAFLALPVLYGWNLVGPARVARAADARERALLYRESIAARLLMFVTCLPVGICVAAVLAPTGNRQLAAAMAVTMMLNGLSPAWFGVGTGKPAWVAIYDAGPRLLGTVTAIPLVLVSGSAYPYPVAVSISTACGIIACSLRQRPTSGERWPNVRAAARSLVRDRSAAATMTIAGSYSAAPVAIAGTVLAVGPLASFVSAERIYRFSLATISSLSDSVQGWVAEARGPQAVRRAARALTAHATLGVSGLIVIVFLGPWLSTVLFSTGLGAGRATFAGFAIAFLAISLNTSLGKHILIPLGKTGWALTSTTVGALAGLASIAVFGHIYGAPGASAAFAASEVAVTTVQAAGCVLVYRTRKSVLSP